MTRRALLTALLLTLPASRAAAQAIAVPLTPDRWMATDSMTFQTYLGRPSLYIDKGIALAPDAQLQDGTIEYDVAATERSSFLGVAFRARALDFAEVLILRPGQSGKDEALQYSPALHGVVAAWQVYRGPSAMAAVTIPRGRWIHVRLELEGDRATVYFDDATAPSLVVPHLAGTEGTAIGVWGGGFGRGAYFSNVSYTPRAPAVVIKPPPPPGTIVAWQLSDAIDPARFDPERLPNLKHLVWRAADVEAPGFVLINRYLAAPSAEAPKDPASLLARADSIARGRPAGAKIVFARAIVWAERAELRRMEFGANDGVVIYVNGRPVIYDMSPQGLTGSMVLRTAGDAVFVPLEKGDNDIVFAVQEAGAGWAFWARLDPP